MPRYVYVRKFLPSLLICCAVIWLGVSPVQADPLPIGSLFSDGTQALQGAGFKVVLPVLTLSQTQNNTTEVGGVGWNGSADYKFTNVDGTGTGADVVLQSNVHSMTYSFQELINNGITDASKLGLIYNANDTGGGLNTELNDVRLRVYDNLGNWVFQTNTCSGGNPVCPGDFPVTNQGQGGDGYLFRLNAAAQTGIASYFSNPGNYRLGLWADISDIDNGPEDFYLRAITTPQPPQEVVPEPSTVLLLGSGLAAVALYKRKYRQ